MDTNPKSRNFLERLLARTGGWYVILSIIFAQIAASISLLLGFLSEQMNASYLPDTLMLLRKIDGIMIPTVSILLIAIVMLLSRNMRSRLDFWKKSPTLFQNEESEIAWTSSNTIIWKYAIAAIILSFGFILIPKAMLLASTGVTTRDQVIYSLISGIITILAFVPFSTMIFDRLLVPVRTTLLPKEYSHQLRGLTNIKIIYKTLAVVCFSLIVTELLIASIGYHQTTRILYEGSGSQKVLSDLKIQSVTVGAFAILFASGLTFLFAKSISDPLALLMDSFQKVENGDLNTRAPVISSDEISQLAIYFNRMVSHLQELQSELEKKVEERTSRLIAINEVGRVATSVLDPAELLKQVVDLITKEFGYYYSALYLIDKTGEYCDLVAATGEAGRVLRESKHQIEITNSNIIGKSIRTRRAQISPDKGEKASRSTNPLLPYTRSEISLPLLVGDQILGALDVHSAQEAAFTDQDIETLQNVANHVGISLDNARLFQETRQRVNELRNIQKQYLREAWMDSSLLQGGTSFSIGESIQLDEENMFEFPIALRDQIIGRLKIGGGENLSLEDINWIQAIATQTALALENARLLEDSQSAAMREKFVTEITNKIWASTSIEGVLQATVRELGQILDATEATIEINIDER